MSNPTIELMASGNLSLTITEDTSWERFPEQAKRFVQRFRSIALYRGVNGVEHLWIVLIRWRPFFLALEDFPFRMTLDSLTRSGNPIVRNLHAELTATAGD